MRGIVRLIRRRPLVTFFVLAYALSWWGSLLEPHTLIPLGPLAAALVVLGVTGGWVAVKDFAGRIAAWRVGLRWYALVLGLPPVIVVTAAGMNVLLGAAPPAFDQAPPLGELVPTFLFIFLLIGVGEEPAWRGFALTRLARGRSLLSAALILSVLHGIWHLPLFGVDFTPANMAPWMLMLTAFSLITAWLYTRTNGNLLLPALFHASVNVSSKYLFLPLFTDGDLIQMYWIAGVLWSIAALGPLARLWTTRAQSEGELSAALAPLAP
jgi:membrane protease YdiL (CAAX protease family)